MATSEPRLEQRGEQHYVAIRRQVAMQQLGTVLPPLHREVFAWLAQNGFAPAGPPFWRYLVIDMDALLEIDVGVPVEAPVATDGQIIAETLPAGRYAVMMHTGHPDQLMGATAELLAWAEQHGIQWQTSDHGKRWAGRVEFYLTDPADEPDMQKWETELAFLTAGS